MFNKEMSPVLNYAMKYDIVNIHSYDGYNGADILKITFRDVNCLVKIRDFTKQFNILTSTKIHDPTTIYIIVEPNEDIYSLK